MEFFESIFKFILSISVGTTAILVYLTINKMWSHKHEIVVAESLSVVAMTINIGATLPFLIYYALQSNWRVTMTSFFKLILFGFLFVAAIGFWVKDSRHEGVWQKLIKALKQEANESMNLVQALNESLQKRELLKILHRVAWIDDVLDDKERQYIEIFAEAWGIDAKAVFTAPPPEKGIEKFNKVRSEVMAYLALKPSQEQALSFKDVLQTLIRIDTHITKEEQLIEAEICTILNNYAEEGETDLYGIIIHPTDREEQDKLLNIVPDAREEYILGTRAFLIAIFHTKTWAEAFCDNYRKRGFFTVVHLYKYQELNDQVN
ncbi:hypothetical protein [Microcoleus sp. F4-D5]|uniref:hypothetical protein n=1 Tax=Microcoleus sp. F4-D5 TaxID=2818760 RepID=UPI002FD346EE